MKQASSRVQWKWCNTLPIPEKEACMWYVGLDAHYRQSTFCVLDEHGRKVRVETIKGPWEKVFLALRKIKKPWAICFEASLGYGVLWQNLQTMAKRVVVAHPGHLHLIF